MTAGAKSNGAFRERPHLTGRAAQLRAAIRAGSDLIPRLASNYLVKGWLDRAALSVAYGASGSGKTFFALDLALHVAAGAAWHGARVRADGSVVYLAAEGGGAFDNRVMAWAAEEPFIWPAAALKFHTLTLPIDLFGSNDAEELVKATADLRPALIVVDTLARVMGKGDENAARDMGMVTMNAGQIIAETGAHLMLVHHSGKEAGRGARGSSSLRGAVDTEISVVKEGGVITATSDKQRDRPSDQQLTYRLRPIQIGVDEDGDPVTSCVVQAVSGEEAVAKARAESEARLTPQQRNALEALRDAAAEHGRVLNGSPNYPARPIVTEQTWRDEFYRRFPGEPAARQKAFSRARKELHDRRLAATFDGHWWTVQAEPGHART